MESYQGGDLSAFEQIFRALAVPLRNYLASLARSRSRGEDLLQETFLQMHRSRRTYTPGRPVKPWAFGIARHVWLMNRRSAIRRGRHEGAAPGDLPEVAAAGFAEMFPEREDLGRALMRVADNRREALLLHHVWGFSFREVGEMLGISERAAKLRSFRGIHELRQLMQEHVDDD
jgi:RNA polymerase sigma-70 factor (ECF subfamily)